MANLPQVDYTPTAASKVTQHRARKVEQDLSFDINQDFDDSDFFFAGPSDDGLSNNFNDLGMSHNVPPIPPSELSLWERISTISTKINLSSGIDLGSDALGEDVFEMLGNVVKGVSLQPLS
jgi:hypothetical protein